PHVAVTLLKDDAVVGQATGLTAESPYAAFGIVDSFIGTDCLGGSLLGAVDTCYLAFPFDFVTGSALDDGAFAFDMKVTPGLAQAYLVGIEGDHASRFSITGQQVGNQAPEADAGADLQTDEGLPVILSGIGSSDPEGATLTYSWSQIGPGPVVQLTASLTPTPSFTAPNVDLDTTLTFRLQVSDGELTSQDDVAVLVRNVGAGGTHAPVANAGLDQTVNEGASVLLDGLVTDADGDLATGTWTQVLQTGQPVVVLTPAAGFDATFTAPPTASTIVLTFQLQGVDAGQRSGLDTVQVTVLDVDPVGSAGSNGASGGGGGGSQAPPADDTPAALPDTPGPQVPPTPTVPPSTGPPAPGEPPCTADHDRSDTLVVTHRSQGGNLLSWQAPDCTPLGYQLWASNSPFVLASSLDGDETSYFDAAGKTTTQYRVTYYEGLTAEQGFFADASSAVAFFGWTPNPATSGGSALPLWVWLVGFAVVAFAAFALTLVLVQNRALAGRREGTDEVYPADEPAPAAGSPQQQG
ncbi:MAG: large repetitive protein, partial [Thermoplasmata archaeon]|nr:large repetitive protein [Thermoplasmata archaeon]